MDAANAQGAVYIPIEWFLGSIASLCAVIGLLAKTIFSLQNQRLEDEKTRSDKVVTALNANSNAHEALTDKLAGGR